MSVAQADVEGLWRRRFIRSAAGLDETTAVYWLQGPSLFVDIRVPAAARGGDASLAAILGCEGFAGTTAVVDSVCTWTREINFRGLAAAPDVGRLAFDGEALVEDGVHASYAERWERAEPRSTPVRIVRITDDANRRSGILGWTPRHFLYALGSGDPRLARDTLEALVGAASGDRERRRLVEAGEHGFGERRQGNWVTTLSTRPDRVGSVFLAGETAAMVAVYPGSPAPFVWRMVCD